MKKIILIILLPYFAISQTIENYNKALKILNKSIKQNDNLNYNSIKLTVSGTINNMGHYEVPEMTREIKIDEDYAFFQNESISYLKSTLQNNGKSYTKNSISKFDSVYEKSYYSNIIEKKLLTGYIFEINKILPSELLKMAFKNRASLRYLGEFETSDMLSISCNKNNAATLFINKKTYLLEKIEYLTYHNRYGDNVNVTEYKDYQNFNGVMIPQKMINYEFGKVERELNFGKPIFDFKITDNKIMLDWLPSEFKQKLILTNSNLEKFEIENISSNLKLIKIVSQNNKVLIAEFFDHVSLFESPAGILLNNQIIEEISKLYPKKPIKKIFLTHHHPDHAGGIRAFTNFPITIISTIGNLGYFDKMLSTSHTLGEINSKTKSQLKFDFVPNDGEKTFKDSLNNLIAFEIGKNTSHTNEHLAFYFPQSKILWTGDLLFFNANGVVRPGGQRAKAIFDLIKEKKLFVEKIYTSWPLSGQKAFGTMDELTKIVEAK